MSSLQPDDLLYLRHMLDSIDQITAYVEGVDHSAFTSSRLLQDAVIRNLEIIGEATKRLSSECKAAQPSVPWKRVAGMRDKLIHDYMGVDVDAVWITVQEHVPQLRAAVLGLLK